MIKSVYTNNDDGRLITNRETSKDTKYGETEINGHKFLVVDYKGQRYIFYQDSEIRKFILSEVFMDEVYKDLEVKGKNVVDIGCGAADTGVYFIANDANHVYGFDINKGYLEAANLNIINNHMVGKISICQPSTDVAISMASINRFVERAGGFDDNRIMALKIDAEGVEYFMLAGSEINDILKYDSIIVECHGIISPITNRLCEYYDMREISYFWTVENKDAVKEKFTTLLFTKKK